MPIKCPICNNFSPDDAIFCTNCGAKININQDMYQHPPQPQQPQQPYYNPYDSQVKKTNTKRILGLLAVIAVTVIILIGLYILVFADNADKSDDSDDEIGLRNSFSIHNDDWQSGSFFNYTASYTYEWSAKRSGTEPYTCSVAGYGPYSLTSDSPHLTINDFKITYVSSNKYGIAPLFGLCYNYKIPGGESSVTSPYIGFELTADTDNGGTSSSVQCRLSCQKDKDSDVVHGSWDDVTLYEGETYKIEVFIQGSNLYLRVDGQLKQILDASDLGTQNYHYLFYRCYSSGGSSSAKIQGYWTTFGIE